VRRASLDILRCPRCRAGSLVPDAPEEPPAGFLARANPGAAEPVLIFGPVRCTGCGARFPVSEGLIDFVSDRGRPSAAQQAMELPWVARSWERYVRPAMDVLLTRSKIDLESEYTVAHSMLGAPAGPVVDLGCGSGVFLRRLVRDFPGQPVIGVDVSRAMIEEALAQVQEHALAADFVRAEVPPLPFADRSLGGVVAAGLLHFIGPLDALLAEAARVLMPGARFVASTFDVYAVAKPLTHSAGLHPRAESDLRAATEKAGLAGFERVKAGPMLVWKAERPR